MKEKIEKAKQKVKNFWNDHKQTIIKVGIAIGAFVGGVAAATISNSTNESTEKISVTPGTAYMPCPKDLEKPDWGKEYEISEYFQERPFVRGMFVETPVQNLGDFGEKLINDCEASHDDFASVIIEYVSFE